MQASRKYLLLVPINITEIRNLSFLLSFREGILYAYRSVVGVRPVNGVVILLLVEQGWQLEQREGHLHIKFLPYKFK